MEQKGHHAGTAENALDGAFRAELVRRLDEFERLPDSAFGEFNLIDWVVSVLFFILIPLLFVWLFR